MSTYPLLLMSSGATAAPRGWTLGRESGSLAAELVLRGSGALAPGGVVVSSHADKVRSLGAPLFRCRP